MKILVTGATGFIGFHVVEYLSNNTNHNIIAVSRGKKSLDGKKWKPSVEFIQANIFDKKANWFDFFGRPDIIIHLAWSNLPNFKEKFHLTENLPNDIIFLNNLLNNGLKSLIVVGTCFEYGLQSGEMKEELPTFPSNPYAIAKDTLRRFLETETKAVNCKFKWLRLFYMYGEGQNPNSLIPQLQNAIFSGAKEINLSGGEQIRDYLPIHSVAEIISKLSLESKNCGIFNVCSGRPIRLKDFIFEYISSFKIDVNLNLNYGFYPYSPLEPMEFWGNNLKVKKILR